MNMDMIEWSVVVAQKLIVGSPWDICMPLEENFWCDFNHIKTKRRLLYLKTQSVPPCKHFSSRL